MAISSRKLNTLFCCIALGLSGVASAKPGDVDTHFGVGGTTSFIVSDSVYDLYPEPIVVDGYNRVIAGTNFLGGAQVNVLTPSGDVDTTFGSAGAIYLNAALRDIAVDSLNRIVVLQTDDTASPEVTRVSRFLPDGAVDMSFGTSGSVDLSWRSDNTYAGGIAIDHDNNVYVDGTVHDIASPPDAHIFVAKLTAAGALDPLFTGSGFNLLHLDSGAEDSAAWAIALDSSNRIVLSGASVNSAGTVGQQVVARLTATGDLDTAFAHGAGFVRLDALASDTAPHNTVGRSIAVDASGNIVVAATAASFSTFESSMVVSRYTAGGEFDSTFAAGAPLFLGTPDLSTQAKALKIDGRANILVSGMSRNTSGDSVPTIFRAKDDGELDTTFASGGMLQLSGPEAASGGYIALTHDGQIVTAAASEISANAWVTKVLDYDPLVIEYPSGF